MVPSGLTTTVDTGRGENITRSAQRASQSSAAVPHGTPKKTALVV